MQRYRYGMRLRGYSIGCQPMDGLLEVCDKHDDDPIMDSHYYHSVLIYNRKLSDKELADYELDYLGAE